MHGSVHGAAMISPMSSSLGTTSPLRCPFYLEFLKNNVGLFYDAEADKQLDEEETNAVIKEMIFYFENCDEDHVYQRLHQNRYYEDGEYDPEKWESVRVELERCRAEALRLFSKWCFHLWY